MLFVAAHLTGGDGGHGVLVPGQREGGVHDAPVPLQGNVPAENNQSEESSQLGADIYMYNDALHNL